MRLFFLSCYMLAGLLILSGCGSSTGSDPDKGGDGNGDENKTQTYSLSVSSDPSGGGSVNPSSDTFDEGEEVTVEATANDGYKFKNWTGDRQSQDNPLTFTINEDTELTANYQLATRYKLDLTVSDGSNNIDQLVIGQKKDATSAFNYGLDKDAPPAPPSGALNAFFEINDLKLFSDYRSSTKQSVDWKLNYQLGTGQDLQLSWELSIDSQSLEGSLTLTDGSGSFSVDMQGESSYTVSGANSGTMLIQYRAD